MTFTLLACETPPSSYEAKPAVRVGRSVNSLIRVRLALVYIGGQVRLKFDGKYKWLTESARAQTRPARPLATGLQTVYIITFPYIICLFFIEI